MNAIGKIIEVSPILKMHSGEIGCCTQRKVCEYLNCNKGEVYVAFDDVNNIHYGKLCKIKEDAFLNNTLAAFDSSDYNKAGEYWENRGWDGNSIVYLDHYKYIMRLG